MCLFVQLTVELSNSIEAQCLLQPDPWMAMRLCDFWHVPALYASQFVELLPFPLDWNWWNKKSRLNFDTLICCVTGFCVCFFFFLSLLHLHWTRWCFLWCGSGCWISSIFFLGFGINFTINIGQFRGFFWLAGCVRFAAGSITNCLFRHICFQFWRCWIINMNMTRYRRQWIVRLSASWFGRFLCCTYRRRHLLHCTRIGFVLTFLRCLIFGFCFCFMWKMG